MFLNNQQSILFLFYNQELNQFKNLAFNLLLADKVLASNQSLYQIQVFRNTSNFQCHQADNFSSNDKYEVAPCIMFLLLYHEYLFKDFQLLVYHALSQYIELYFNKIAYCSQIHFYQLLRYNFQNLC